MTDSPVRKISNSEVSSWLSCRLQYYFQFYRNLAPLTSSVPLDRGNLFHLAMEYYIKSRIAGHAHQQASEAGTLAFHEALRDGIDSAVVMETKIIYDRHMRICNGYPDWDWLGSEEQLDLVVNDKLAIPIRYDFYVFDRKQQKYIIGDFKTTFNFWQPWEHELNAQMPKYITIMNANGIRVDLGLLVEVRTRSLKSEDPKDHLKFTRYLPSKAKQKNMMRQHLLASQEIIEYREGDDEFREMKNIPLFNKHGACKVCAFKNVCDIKVSGGEIESTIAAEYKQNTSYGYNAENKAIEANKNELEGLL